MEALTLFNVLFSDLREDEFIEVSIHAPGDNEPRQINVIYTNDVQAAANFADKYSTGYNVWFGVFPRKRRSGTKDSVSRRTCVYVDIDVPPEQALRKIEDFLLPPTAVVYSGRHLQAYFVTHERDIEQNVFDKLMDQLIAHFGADGIKNINRLLRVPGTQHMKDPTTPRLCTMMLPGAGVTQGAIYSVKDLFAAVNLGQNTRRLALSKKVPSKYQTADGQPDRSRRDFVVIKDFQKHGLSDDTIRFIAHRLPFGDRYRERRGEDLLEYDLKNAGTVKRSNGKIASKSAFREEPDGYYFHDTQVSTFTLHPTSVVESLDGDVIICTVKAGEREWRNVPFDRRVFVGTKEFMGALSSISWQWLGNAQNFKFLLPYLDQVITEKDIPRVRAIDYTGYVDGFFVSDNQILNASGLTDEMPYALLGHKRERIQTKWQTPKDDGLNEKIMSLLPMTNQPHVVWLVFGWFMAAPFKQVLWNEADGAQFPILNAFGTQGAGKSSSVTEIFQRLLGLKESEWMVTTTDFNIIKHISASNVFPLIMSEYRESDPKSGDITRYLRGSYTNSVDGRGRTDQGTNKYKLHRPVVVTGEDGITDAATKERSIRVHYNKTWLLTHPDAKKAFKELKRLPLESFAIPYLTHALRMIDAGKHIDLYERCVESMVELEAQGGETIPDRVLANMTMVWFGLEAARDFLGITMPKLDIAPLFKDYLDELLGRGRTVESLSDVFVTDIINQYFMYLMRTVSIPPFTVKYEPDTKTFWFRHKDAISWWVQKRAKERLPALTQKAITDQIQESSYYAGRQGHCILGCNTYLYGVSLSKAQEYGLDVPDDLPDTGEFIIRYETKHSA